MERILVQLIERFFHLLKFALTKSILAVLAFLVILELCQCAPTKLQGEGSDPLDSFPVFGLNAGHPENWNRDGNSGVSKRETETKPGENSLGTGLVKFDLGNATAVNYAVTGFIKSAETIVRELLISTQSGLLRMIGQVDHGIDRFQKRLQNTTFRLTLAGQKAAAQAYEALPPFANKLIQRLGTPTDASARQQLSTQLNEVVNNWRKLTKQFLDDFEEHEHDWDSHFQERFTEINQYLRVPNLPRRPFGWY